MDLRHHEPRTASEQIYLADHELGDDECEHLTHQHLARIPAFIAALGRTATEPAALDTGRGPEIFNDEQLAHIETTLGVSEAEGLSQTDDGSESELFVDYVNLRREVQDRHRDRVATVAYQPPEWVIDTLGERPADHETCTAWDAIVDRVLRYRTDQGIRDEATDLLGPQPPSSDADTRVAWIAARRDIERDLPTPVAEDQGVGFGV